MAASKATSKARPAGVSDSKNDPVRFVPPARGWFVGEYIHTLETVPAALKIGSAGNDELYQGYLFQSTQPLLRRQLIHKYAHPEGEAVVGNRRQFVVLF